MTRNEHELRGEVTQLLGPDDVRDYAVGNDLAERVLSTGESIAILQTRELTLLERVRGLWPFSRNDEACPVVLLPPEVAETAVVGDTLVLEETRGATVTRDLEGVREVVV